MTVLETRRLALRRLDLHDAPFILALLNQERFIRFIGDKGVRDIADARDYLLQGPIDSYRRFGFGLYLAALRCGAPSAAGAGPGGEPIGICGLVKRDGLADVDVGFAFMPAHESQGYATESAAAVLEYGRRSLGLSRIVAIVAPDNRACIAVLTKIGLRFERMIELARDRAEVCLYGPAAKTESG